ncbi:hypothetical protein ABTW96_33290 [Nocardia beijingensis]|uniref:hypothetical protein n=1 Tax=Nocardia beijingensis TaxID=95162 RepID=UPI003317762E
MTSQFADEASRRSTEVLFASTLFDIAAPAMRAHRHFRTFGSDRAPRRRLIANFATASEWAILWSNPDISIGQWERVARWRPDE